MNRRDELEYKAQNLPLAPGCYMFLDREGNVLYVGKSKCLKKRVTSYFGNVKFEKFKVMLRFADSIEIVETNTDIEALLLEHALIKKHRPQYNSKMRKDYQQWYLKFADGIIVTLETDPPGFFVGPFSHKETAVEALEILGKCFKLPTCNKAFRRNTRMCLNGHMKKCVAPCEKSESTDDIYQSAIKFLQGNHKEVFSKIQKEMQLAIKNMEFEKAAEYKASYGELKQLSDFVANMAPVLVKKRFVVYLKSRHEACFMLACLDDGKCLATIMLDSSEDVDKINDFAEEISLSCLSVNRPSYKFPGTCEENKAFVRALVEVSAIRRFYEINSEHTCAFELSGFLKEMIL